MSNYKQTRNIATRVSREMRTLAHLAGKHSTRAWRTHSTRVLARLAGTRRAQRGGVTTPLARPRPRAAFSCA